MDNETLKVPKTLHPVTLWVHPEGRVIGSIYLRQQSPNHAGPEQPLDVLNEPQNFLVFNYDQQPGHRFYNRKSITRVEYKATDADLSGGKNPMECHLQMMDGSYIKGTIRESLLPHHARLLDYLNRSEESFIKMYLDNDLIYLINKSYINHVHVADIGDE